MSRKFACGAPGLWASEDYVPHHGLPQTPDELEAHRIIGFSRIPESFG
jgi:hypothetical protein